MRIDRNKDQLRDIDIETKVSPFAEGSCVYKQGLTKVWCTATLEQGVPSWKEDEKGWVTAEYAMLPRANRSRMMRESKSGKPSGRSLEISRLIARALRASVDLEDLAGFTITVDCDVLTADGGTRCASISAGYVALVLALEKAYAEGAIERKIRTKHVAAVSVGLLGQEILVDLDYPEDAAADVDLNLVLDEDLGIVEIQASSEKMVMTKEVMDQMVEAATQGIQAIFSKQRKALDHGAY